MREHTKPSIHCGDVVKANVQSEKLLHPKIQEK